jgi:hypothetical protein
MTFINILNSEQVGGWLMWILEVYSFRCECRYKAEALTKASEVFDNPHLYLNAEDLERFQKESGSFKPSDCIGLNEPASGSSFQGVWGGHTVLQRSGIF